MLKHYFKTAMRNFMKYKTLSLVNIMGLSTGLACCILILLFIKDELSFDQFHNNIDNIYQLTCNRIEKDGTREQFAIAAMVQGPAFKKEIPEIETFTRVNQKQLVIKKDNEAFTENITWVDDNFFSVFSFSLIRGDKKNVFSSQRSIVLTAEAAKKYFGSIDVIGKPLQVEINNQFESFTVTGLAKDPPQNSSIQFSILLPFKYLEQTNPDNGWMWVSYPTYFLLHPGADIAAIETKMKKIFQTQAGSEIEMNHLAGYDNSFTWGVQPLVNMHLNTMYAGQPEGSKLLYSYILSGIAFFILLIACINFVNLTVARSLKRSKEIGIRKAAGGQKNQLRLQFLGESLLLCFFSFVLALLLSQMLLPVFNSLANKKLSLFYLFDFKLIACFIALFIFTGFMSGFYPALVLSALNPVNALYNRSSAGGRHLLLRTLVILQFSIATFLIIGTLFMHKQFDYLITSNLGYADQNLAEFTVEKAVVNKPLMDLFKTAVSKLSGIETIGYTNVGKFGGKTEAGGNTFTATYQRVDENYLSVLQPVFLTGRNFSRAYPTDSINAIIVNEAFVKAAGWQDGTGKTVDMMSLPGWGNKRIMVIGVIKDYHFESLREKIRPILFTMDQHLPLGCFIVRLNASHIAATMHQLEKTYHTLIPDSPFQYYFKEDLNRKNYDAEYRWKQVISFGALLTIFISCTGLFALAMLSIQNRSKEISIRKVLGASVIQMINLLAFDVVKLVCIAFLIAVPLSWYVLNKWLQNFAYHINLSWWLFGLAGALTLAFALFTVGFHAIKVSLVKPAAALRQD